MFGAVLFGLGACVKASDINTKVYLSIILD
jgi:hypothetical protein